MKLLNLLILNTFLLFYCNSTQEPDKKLIGLYKVFDKKHIEHFPVKSTYLLRKYSYLAPLEGIRENKGGYLKVMYSLRKAEFDSLEKELRQTAIKETTHADSCNLFIERGVNPEIEYINKTCDEFYPVPVFLEEMDFINVQDYSSLPKDFKLYILEASKGIFLKEEYLSEELAMPIEWKHGITRGVALSQERYLALFWVDIW